MNIDNKMNLLEPILIPGEWELVDQGWPTEDFLDTVNGKKTQFYYIKDSIIDQKEWKLKDSFKQNFKKVESLYKLSFKVKDKNSQILSRNLIIYKSLNRLGFIQKAQ